jgi:hypothetical protein
MGILARTSRLLLVLVMLLSAVYATAAGAQGGALTPAAGGGARAAQASPGPVPTARATQVVVPLPTPVPTPAVAPTSAVFARVGGVPLVHPAARVERIGFHQASDVNSLGLTPATTAVRARVLPSRHRPTPSHSAADIVVHPQSEIFAPVSGIVKRAGNYRLYCKTPDSFAVISPAGHPELEIKLLHISGLRVRPGDRVVAGKTLLAKRPTKLPFGSQVDAYSSHRPAWPHVHMEATRLTEPSATPVAGPSTLAFGRCG